MMDNNTNKPPDATKVAPVNSQSQSMPPVPPPPPDSTPTPPSPLEVTQASASEPEPLTPEKATAPDNSSLQPLPESPGAPPPTPKVVTPKTKSSKFPIVIAFLVVVAIAVYGFVAYLYFDNQKLKEDAESQGLSDTLSTPQIPTPIPTSVPDNFEIDNGDITRVTSTGSKTVIVAKDDYEDTGLIGFTNVNSSPDNENICFWSLPPALDPALYYSNSNGGEVVNIANRSVGCTWSNFGDMIAYINDAPTGTAVDISVYDLLTQDSTNLTQASTESAVYRRYEIESWSEDDEMINCNYEEIDTTDTSAEVVGNCQIDVVEKVVTDL
jgi:hypothetical protein